MRRTAVAAALACAFCAPAVAQNEAAVAAPVAAQTEVANAAPVAAQSAPGDATPAAVQTEPAVAAPATAPTGPTGAEQAVTEELYQSALQSIAEGRKNDASKTLMRVIEQEPLHAGAWLDLAMIQCGLGHADEAERLFAAIETRFNPSQGMLEIIANERDTGCRAWQGSSSSALAFGRGIDQNVNQGATNPSYIVGTNGGQIEYGLLEEFLPKHDQYSLMSGEYTREITPNGTIGFAQFQARHNDSLTNYDSASLFAGLESPYRFGRWTLRTTAMMGLVSLGGRLYQRQVQLQARIGPPLPLPNSTQFNLMGGVTRTEFLTLTNFDSETYEMRGQFTHRNNGLYASTSLGYQYDKAGELRPGGSRNGWFVNLVARRRLAEQLTGELNYTRQSWHSKRAYLPGLIDDVRDQVTHVVRGAFVYPLGKNHAIQLEARLVRNRENISLFQYNNRQLQLSWQWHQP